MEALSPPNLHTETFCFIFSLHKDDHTLGNCHQAFQRLHRHFENVQISACCEPLTDMETSSGVPDVFMEASSYFDIHLRMRKMDVFILSSVVLARRPESLLGAVPRPLQSTGEDVMGAALMSTEMINEFTHNEELRSSLPELFITLELTSRQGQPVVSVRRSSF